MSGDFSAAILIGSVAVITLAAEPQSTGSPDSTLPGTIDTAGYSVYRYADTGGKYRTTSKPKEPEASQQQSNMQTGRQVNGSQEAQEPGFTSAPLSSKSKAIIQGELKSASTLAKTGAVFYGIGFGVEIIGAIIFIDDVASYNDARDNSYYYYGPSTPPLKGLYVVLAGGATSFIGSIVANFGGSKSRNTLQAAYGDAPSFHGWGYFWGGFACSAMGSVLSMSEVPILPFALSLTGSILNLCSVISSVGYSNRGYLRSVVLSDLHISPMVDMKNFRINGLMISGSF